MHSCRDRTVRFGQTDYPYPFPTRAIHCSFLCSYFNGTIRVCRWFTGSGSSFAARHLLLCFERCADAAFDSQRSVRQAVLAGLFDLPNDRIGAVAGPVRVALFVRRQRHHEVDDAAAHFWVANA